MTLNKYKWEIFLVIKKLPCAWSFPLFWFRSQSAKKVIFMKKKHKNNIIPSSDEKLELQWAKNTLSLWFRLCFDYSIQISSTSEEAKNFSRREKSENQNGKFCFVIFIQSPTGVFPIFVKHGDSNQKKSLGKWKSCIPQIYWHWLLRHRRVHRFNSFALPRV